MKKIAIITGSNTGLGYWNALDLSKEGYKVIMACRTPARAEEAKQKILDSNPQADLDILQIDLSSLQSVRDFVTEFKSKYNQLDLLINNAGIMLVPESRTEDGFESTMAANYFGHFLLTGLLLDTIKNTPDSRVVSLSSIAHTSGEINLTDINFEQGYSSWKVYSQSKLACLMFAYELQRRFDKVGIKTLSVASHPGFSTTDLSRHIPLPKILRSLIINTVFRFGSQSAEAGSKPTLLAALGEDVQGGDYFGPTGFREMKGEAGKVESTELSHDEELARQLWELSEQLTGYTYSF